jgi:hypothetical protein
MLKEPFDRPAAERNEAVVDLFRLLGSVNVYRSILDCSDDGVERFGCHGAERMRRDTHIGVGQSGDDLTRARDNLEEPVGIIEEAPLFGRGC